MSDLTHLFDLLQAHRDRIEIKHLGIHIQQPAPTVSEELPAHTSEQMVRRRRDWTEEEDQYLRDHYADTMNKVIGERLGRSTIAVNHRGKKLGLDKSEKHISSLMSPEIGKAHRFQKGHTSWNKGRKIPLTKEMIKAQFPKGHIPKNTVSIGAITSRRNQNGIEHFWIKLGDKKWAQLKNHIWEQANGPIPSGYMVAFKDKNPKNCVIENLMLLTRQENMLRNTIHNYPEEVKASIRLLSKLKRKINEHEKQNDGPPEPSVRRLGAAQ
ncbi:HNH endonuclease signature motif containing protein [uncultured Algoriphagus sp.]|uniref:HNH endonuclease signature motif containing protein n=1 Tax=uncultured Algoriphagus sp. TaxID=417365 RepID=UPI002595EFCC|nr:HNH endonuclease signature motif containing protein [uncultured Algoriphagus sp.]